MSVHTKIEAASWHEAPAAAAILSGLTPAHVSIVPRTPIVGPRFYEWTAGEVDERLYEVRRAFVDAAFGKAFADCYTDDERRAYLACDMHYESVADALRGLFGAPWGVPTDRLIDCDRGAAVNAAWRRGQVAA